MAVEDSRSEEFAVWCWLHDQERHMLKATVLGATLMLAQIACPLGGGGGTDMSEDPTPEQCDRQEGVLLQQLRA